MGLGLLHVAGRSHAVAASAVSTAALKSAGPIVTSMPPRLKKAHPRNLTTGYPSRDLGVKSDLIVWPNIA